MATYRTPDVYVEEISVFPPSVAEVETAIPAFIGYTAKAERIRPGDLLNEPIAITSLLEFEQLYGGAAPMVVNEIVLDEQNAVQTFDLKNSFYLYDSLRLFFQNGGGKCYIISVGLYAAAAKTKAEFLTGLTALKRMDEPTLILFPDAVMLGEDLYEVQKQTLEQCGILMDRFGIFDMLESKAADPAFGWQQGVQAFRDSVGMNQLKYGAVYTPWLKSNLGVTIRYRDILGKVFRGGSAIGLDTLTTNAEAKKMITDLNTAISDSGIISADLAALLTGKLNVRAKYLALADTFKTTPNAANFTALFNFIYGVVVKVDEWAAKANNLKTANLKTDIKNLIAGSLKDTVSKLIAYDKAANTELAGSAFNLYAAVTVSATQWGGIFGASSPAADTSIFAGADDAAKMKAAEPKLTDIASAVSAAVSQILTSTANYESTFEQSLLAAFPVYRNLIATVSNATTILPPSGAIAGVYATVDRNRGVWKSPANVSLNSVIGVTKVINNSEQQDLNVDVNAGKSVNAIRPFTGKGIMVWGARTLAGNDNEWRYVSVRRFFNMVEESIKKSTSWAVFEPNDANTWIKVKSMIENYLTLKWREGALAGAKPDQAFYVKVGLGVTMTSQDVLEGRMNVEIGMAAVRPAEFIVLKFAHKMQQS